MWKELMEQGHDFIKNPDCWYTWKIRTPEGKIVKMYEKEDRLTDEEKDYFWERHRECMALKLKWYEGHCVYSKEYTHYLSDS